MPQLYHQIPDWYCRIFRQMHQSFIIRFLNIEVIQKNNSLDQEVLINDLKDLPDWNPPAFKWIIPMPLDLGAVARGTNLHCSMTHRRTTAPDFAFPTASLSGPRESFGPMICHSRTVKGGRYPLIASFYFSVEITTSQLFAPQWAAGSLRSHSNVPLTCFFFYFFFPPSWKTRLGWS